MSELVFVRSEDEYLAAFAHVLALALSALVDSGISPVFFDRFLFNHVHLHSWSNIYRFVRSTSSAGDNDTRVRIRCTVKRHSEHATIFTQLSR